MRIRWGRVLATVGTLTLGPLLLAGAFFWVTAPEPATPVRQDPGPLSCVTGELLVGALPMHTDHRDDPTRDERDEGAAAALMAATRCAEVRGVTDMQWMEVFYLATHGLAWIEANEPPDEALRRVVEVWELARDQQQAGVFMDAFTWQAVALEAAKAAERLTAEGQGVRARVAHAQVRPALERLAEGEIDWDSIRAREEQMLWSLDFPAPRGLSSALEIAITLPRELLRLRYGYSDFIEDHASNLQKERELAAALAQRM